MEPLQWWARPPALTGARLGVLELHMTVPEGFHLYRDQLEVRVLDPGTLQVGEPDYPEGHHIEVVVQLPIQTSPETSPGLATLIVSVHHQGCYEGTCLPPQRRDLRVLIPVRAEDYSEKTCSVDDEDVEE